MVLRVLHFTSGGGGVCGARSVRLFHDYLHWKTVSSEHSGDARPGLGAAGQRLWSRLKHPERFGWLLLNQEEATQELQYGQLLTRKGLSCVN